MQTAAILPMYGFLMLRSENLPEDKKSVAISVTFQPKDKTYTDAELEALMNKVILEVGKKTGAVFCDRPFFNNRYKDSRRIIPTAVVVI